MHTRRIALVAALGVLALGAYAPATAAPKKKPITKSYDLNLAPIPVPPTEACAEESFEGVSIHTETIKPTGPGILSVKVTGFTGDWDIAIKDAAFDEIAMGDGSTTPNPGPGEDTAVVKFKKAETINIAICNFAGSPAAKASFTYTYR